jgi:Cytochrome c oxidase subunit III
VGIEGVNPFELPLLNTIILLSSGVTITYAHHVRGQCSCVKSHLRDIYFSYIYAVLELGRGENPILNIASHVLINFSLNLLKLIINLTVLSKVKA